MVFFLGFINSSSSAESSGCAKVEFYPSLLPSAHVGGAGGDFLADKVGLCRPRWVCAAPGGSVPPWLREMPDLCPRRARAAQPQLCPA